MNRVNGTDSAGFPPTCRGLWLAFLLAGLSPCLAQNQGVVVITEIMYHPRGGGQDLEFVEIHNASSHPVDLTGWFFSRGIFYEFPDRTWLDGGQYLVVCANEEQVRETYGITNTLGDWGVDCAQSDAGEGCALSNAGEVIELSKQSGVVHARVRYNDRGKWPAGADGTGHSLVLRYVYSEQDDPDRWALSGQFGGSPGEPNQAQADFPVVLNEALLWTEGERWVELFNRSETETIDLSGFWMTDERDTPNKVQLPPGTSIAPRDFLVLSEAELGLELAPSAREEGSPARTFLALSHADGSRVLDAYIFEPEGLEKSEARIPDGDQSFSAYAEPTRGLENRVDVEEDIVINEVMYHPIDLNPSAEYIELYNRGDQAVELTGWRLTQGFNFEFPEGTVIEPQGYLVVSSDPPYIREVYGLPATQVLGPDPADQEAVEDFGILRDDGERITLRDQNGNVADTVRYHDGGQWPLWADGGGSSMELVDPFHNNNVASAWDSSDDSHKAEVQQISYEGPYVTNQPEFHLVLNQRGIALVDDLRLFQRETTFQPSETIIDVGDEWRYFKGTQEASDPRERWREPDFDDTDWLTGTTPIGYGEDDEGTVLEDMRQLRDDEDTPDVDESQPGYLAVFCRKTFEIPDLQAIQNLVLELEYDDGLIAYLNGTTIATENMRDNCDTFDCRARSSRERATAQIDLTERLDLLRAGTNVLAVQFHNSSISSSDARFVARFSNGVFVNEDGPNHIQGGDFEEELIPGFRAGGWVFEGTHVRSGRTFNDPLSGTASLKIVASAKGDNKVNRIESTLPNMQPRTNYKIEFKAKWVVGSATMLSHGHNQASASFDYPKSHLLGVPRNLGTPGAPNSVTLRHVADTGSFNIGPAISRVSQTPTLPRAGEDVEVRARVEDPDGVEAVRLHYWLEDTRGSPGPNQTQEVVMEGPDVGGFYRATIPGQTSRTRVVFHITATDAGGREGRYPLDNRRRTHPLTLDPEDPPLSDLSFLVYRHDNPARPQNPRWKSYRLWMSHVQETQMQRQRLLSNDRYEGSFLFDNTDLYYNARTRFSGSPWARAGFGGSYRVYMPKDKPLHGSPFIKRFNMEDHQSGGSRSCLERLSHYLIRHNQGSIRVPHAFQWLVQWQMNDRINTAREHIQAPNRQFVEYWYPGDDDGDLFEVDDRFEINDGGTRQNSIDARWAYPPMRTGDGDDKENYRWFFNLRLHKSWDDYSSLIETAKILDPRITRDPEFDELVWEHIDVEQMLRQWAIRMNTDDWDTWGTDRGKNCYLYRPRLDGRWKDFPWDMELTYSDVNRFMPPQITQTYSTINGGKFPEVVRMINRPRIKRLYYGIMKEMVDHQFNSDFLAPYMTRLNALGMVNTDRMRRGGWIDQRNQRLRGILTSAIRPRVQLAITTNGGEPFATEKPVVTIEGRAPVEISYILVLVNGLEPVEPVAVHFSNSDYFAWHAVVPLGPGMNTIEFIGTGSTGDEVESVSIDVSATLRRPTITAIAPPQSYSGETVEILGDGFFPGISILFGGVQGFKADLNLVEPPARVEAIVPDEVAPGVVDVVAISADLQISDPFAFEVLSRVKHFLRGDVNQSGRVSIDDGVQILFYLFNGGELPCEDAADLDDSGALNLTDPVLIFNFLFSRGVPPAAPFPEAGEDPTADEIDCATGV